MARALELAARGQGQVSPSPLVGCVIARGGEEVIGEGFYLYDGVKHAETLALEQAGGRARGATAYVSLEPHAHQGRTPPCTTALIEAGIERVVAPIEDPNPVVSGRGFAELRAAGLAVEVGLMELEAARLNEKYIHSHRHSRPFVHLKLACSLDGRIATRTGDARWITGESARRRVHQLRHEYDAILIGAGTATADDPLLTDRSGRPRRRPLVRVLLDDDLRLSPASQLVRTARETPLLVFTSDENAAEGTNALERCGVEVVRLRGGARDLNLVLASLHQRALQSLLIEGGGIIAGLFHDAELLDKVSFFVAPLLIGGSAATAAIGGAGAESIASALRLHHTTYTPHGDDIEITGYPEQRGQRSKVRD